MKMQIIVTLLLAVTSASCFEQIRSSKTKESTFEETYRNDPRPVCQGKPFNATNAAIQNERHLIKPNILGIANGGYAVKNEFPYATVLFNNKETDEDITNTCGATLITDQHVLTARHCAKFKDIDDTEMSIGEIDLRGDKPHLIGNISGLYKEVGLLDDIAIIELAHPVTFGHNKVIKRDVYVADLPGPDYVIKKGEVMSIFGWGKTEKSHQSMILKTAHVRLDNEDEKLCNNSEKISICVVGAHSSEHACFGDSGNGLIYRDKGKEVVVGVMSESFGDCGQKHAISKYMRVSAYAEHIYKHTLDARCKPSFVFSNTFEKRYRNDPRPLCQDKPFNATSSTQNYSHPILGISYGRLALKNEFPYATVLFETNNIYNGIIGNISNAGGATLITDQHVLTARKCINDKHMEDIDMSIGEIDLREDLPHLFSNSSGFYKDTGLLDDIAIIELAKPVTFGYNKAIQRDVYVADLPGPDYVIKDGEVMSIYGWGKTEKNMESLHLKTANVRMAKEDAILCNRTANVSICVTGKHPYEKACFGDSGNGMIYRDYGKEVVVGVMISTLGNCDEEKVAMEYTKVSNYAEYIYNHTLSAGCKPIFVF